MKHFMKLCKDPFDMIYNGEKTIELRLYDEKRQKVKIGDTIVFSCPKYSSKELVAEVINIYVYDSFVELYDSLPLEKCGYKVGESADPSDMNLYYSEDLQKKYGAVGIEITLVK